MFLSPGCGAVEQTQRRAASRISLDHSIFKTIREGPNGGCRAGREIYGLEHLAVKDLVLFFTRPARCADTASDQQGRAKGDKKCRAVRLKLQEPVCEVVKMKRMHCDTPLLYETRSLG